MSQFFELLLKYHTDNGDRPILNAADLAALYTKSEYEAIRKFVTMVDIEGYENFMLWLTSTQDQRYTGYSSLPTEDNAKQIEKVLALRERHAHLNWVLPKIHWMVKEITGIQPFRDQFDQDMIGAIEDFVRKALKNAKTE